MAGARGPARRQLVDGSRGIGLFAAQVVGALRAAAGQLRQPRNRRRSAGTMAMARAVAARLGRYLPALATAALLLVAWPSLREMVRRHP